MNKTEDKIRALAEDEENQTTAIVPHMIRPIVEVEEALKAWKEYQSLKTKLSDKNDFVKIGNKEHPTKQFANKLAKFFGLSVEILKAEKEENDRDFTWHIWSRAIAPNGQFRDGDGHCSSTERSFAHLEHDVYATATTRAKNRAILELAGFGEVSAEEMTDGGKSNVSAKVTKKGAKPPSPTPDDDSGNSGDISELVEEAEEEKTKCEELALWFNADLTNKTLDKKDFKEKLSVAQEKMTPERKFVGKKFGNLSFSEGKIEDLEWLKRHWDKVTAQYIERKQEEQNGK